MSAEIFNRLRHLVEQVQHLVAEVDNLSERVLALEAAQESGEHIDIDTLEPVKRGPGRPRKVAQ